MQRIVPMGSRERITSCDNLNRYFAALSPSSACGHGSACESSLPWDGPAMADMVCCSAVVASFIAIESFVQIAALGGLMVRAGAKRSLTILRRCATFVSSLERGVGRSLLWSTEKSSHRSVVTRHGHV